MMSTCVWFFVLLFILLILRLRHRLLLALVY